MERKKLITFSTLVTAMGDEKPKKPKVKKPPEVKFPKRTPSVVIPPRKVVFVTADKLTCDECICYPIEDPYTKPKKLAPCQFTPRTLYELAADAVDRLWPPDCFFWTLEDLVTWIGEDLGFPQYMDCLIKNNIDGMRLIMLEDPSNLARINIRNFEHIKIIEKGVHELVDTEIVRFARSIGLPPRLPLTHCSWFRSRTGPSWGIRIKWQRSDLLRWMKIINPKPLKLDHWDLVWYQKPDFPKTLFGKIPKVETSKLVWFRDAVENCNEYEAPRKFKLANREKDQFIWMEHARDSPSRKKSVEYLDEIKRKAMLKKPVKKESRLMPPKISLEGLTGKDLLLARRRMPKQKFLA